MAATAAIVLIIGLMAGTTTATRLSGSAEGAAAAAKPKPTPTPTPTPLPTPTPTPTPTSDNRTVYFGDAPKSVAGDGVLVPSIVTAGNTFEFDLFVENEGNQRLTHAEIGYGSLAVVRTGSNPSLPAGASIVSATLEGAPCTIAEDLLGARCDVGQFDAGEQATAHFVVNAPSVAVTTTTYASFKVAENVPDQGANRNTFYADTSLEVGPTNSNSNATYKLGNGSFSLSTAGQTQIKKDSMTTTVTVPGDTSAGAISIFETDCDDTCTGQIATVHVRNGADQTPYLLWRLVIVGQLDDPVVVTHTLDDGTEVQIFEPCVGDTDTDCIESVVEQGNMTTIDFRTLTNGRVRV